MIVSLYFLRGVVEFYGLLAEKPELAAIKIVSRRGNGMISETV